MLTKPYFSKEHAYFLTADTIFSERKPYFAPPPSTRSNAGLLAGSGLEHNGSLMRGINLSTGSSASLTSALQLQLQGKLSRELSITAAISDQSLPATAEGNTASLQEFDKIFISIFSDRSSLSAGDVELKQTAGFFDRYSRQALGAAFATRQQKDDVAYASSVSAGVGKGKFARQALAVLDGNQGAYLLQGGEGERNIVVLSGSERVFADGRLLERGADADYTISYATAEITFMPRFMVTQNLRIVVEFEYSERSYARYLANASNALRVGRGGAYLNVFYEGDAKSQPIDASLSEAEKQQMAMAGAQYWRAIATAVDSVEYNTNEVLYRRRDTLVNGTTQRVYEYSVNPREACYRLRFADVGQGNGSYRLASSAANGRVYEWVGSGSGSYEPQRLLVTPKQKFLLTAGAFFSPDTLSNMAVDAALSSSSANLYASPSVARTGFAVNARGDKSWMLGQQNKLTAGASAMLFDSRFETPERFVSAEYERDWNLEGTLAGRDFGEYTGRLGFRHADKLRLNASLAAISAGTTDAALSPLDTSYRAMQGGKVQADFWLRHRGFASELSGSLVRTEQSNRSTTFVRAKGEVSQRVGQLRVGLRGELEGNQMAAANSAVSLGSAAFHSEEIFVRSDSARHSLEVFARNRADLLPGKMPRNGELKTFTQAQDVGLSGELRGQLVRNKITATYRHLTYADSTARDHVLLGRNEFSGRFAQGFATTNAMYELGAGIEPKQDFIYVDVGVGQGVYAWRDYNGNGVCELNEFEVAAFRDEASYIRIALPSREYVQAFTGKFALYLHLAPAAIIEQRRGLAGFASRLSSTFSYSNAHKNLRNSFAANANPFFDEPLTDTAVVNQSYAAVSTLSYLSASAKTKIDLSWQGSSTKNLLVSGAEIRQSDALGLNLQQRVGAALRLNAGALRELKTYRTQYATAGTSYDVEGYSLSAGGELQALMHLRLSATYKFSDKDNRSGIESAQLHDARLEATYNFPQKGMASVNLGLMSTKLNGSTASAVGYELLQGYGAGRNLTWGASLQRVLGGSIELSLLYSARRLPEGRVVHGGGVEIKFKI
jgi:hypothetical protein